MYSKILIDSELHNSENFYKSFPDSNNYDYSNKESNQRNYMKVKINGEKYTKDTSILLTFECSQKTKVDITSTSLNHFSSVDFFIYEIIKENERFYIVIDNNDEILSKIDKLILPDEIDTKNEEIVVKNHGNPISKEKIMSLFNMDKSICKIFFEANKGEKVKDYGFFCRIDNFPINYALFTNNHVLNE
jgi:hypothetical protein